MGTVLRGVGVVLIRRVGLHMEVIKTGAVIFGGDGLFAVFGGFGGGEVVGG